MSFWSDTRAAATALMAVLVALMTVGAGALITDHVVLVDQRDTLRSASSAAAIAATQELHRVLEGDSGISDDDLKAALTPVARAYIGANLLHLPRDRYDRALQTLVVEVRPDRSRGTVDVRAQADLGGFFFSSSLPLLSGVKQIDAMSVESRVESTINPVEVVLAIDISGSMKTDLKGHFRTPGKQRIAIVKQAATELVNILAPDERNRVAVGLVPWHHHIRLDGAVARTWENRGWASYPIRRRYDVPYINCEWWSQSCTNLPAAVEQALPATAPETWQGCLTEDRFAAGATRPDLPPTASLLDLPADRAFAQSFFRAGWGFSYRCFDPSTPDDLPAGFQSQFCYKRPPGDSDALESGWWSYFIQVNEAQSGCGKEPPILPLSTDPVKVRSAIAALDAVGVNTYSALGVLWSHRLLLPSWKGALPGDSSMHPVGSDAPDVRKAIVLLTDGEDTQCGFDNPDCDDSTLGIARADACTLAKQAGIEIFIVAAMHPDKVSGDFARSLRECSSEADHPDGTYVFLNNATPERLSGAFSNIAGQLMSIRRVY